MYTIRPAKPKDLNQILSVFQETILKSPTHYYTQTQILKWASAAKYKEKWSLKIQNQHFFVAEQAHKIIGFSSIEQGGYIDNIYVLTEHQRKGIASCLLEQLEKDPFALQQPNIWADVSLIAKPFFLKKGFIISEQHLKNIDRISFTNYIMTKQLNPSNELNPIDHK